MAPGIVDEGIADRHTGIGKMLDHRLGDSFHVGLVSRMIGNLEQQLIID